MKKSLLLFSALFASVAGNAQITITQSDLVTIGKTIYQGHDTVVTLSAGPSGANVNWNFSSLVADTKDTIDVVAPSATPYGSNFPGSNMAGYSHGDGGDFVFYVNSSASAFTLDGYAGQGLLIDFNPNEVVTPLSATYGTTISNTFKYSTDIPYPSFPGYDSLRVKNSTVKTGSYDAYGSLTLQMGTYNTIRLAETRISTDSLFLHSTGPFPPAGWAFIQESKDTTYRYAWYANNVGYALVELDSNRVDGKSAGFLLAEPLSVAAAKAEQFSVYPNPATGFVNVVYNGATNDIISIYDLTGHLVRTEVLVKGNNRIDIQSLSAGMYLYNVTATNGTITGSGKFSVTK